MPRKTVKKSRSFPTEWHLHAALIDYLCIVQRLSGGLAFHHSPNEGKRGLKAQQSLKRLGTQAGEPDLALYLAGGLVVFVEIKTPRGIVSDEQKRRHAELRALGFRVEIVRAGSTTELIAAVAALLVELGVTRLPRLAA
jgi:hypothetical protein